MNLAYHKEFLYQSAKSKTCTQCQASTKSIVFYRSRFIYEGYKVDPDEDHDVNVGARSKKARKDGDREKTELKPHELKKHFRKLWETDSDLLLSLFPMLDNKSKHPTDLFFVDVLSVPPPKTRPCQYTGGMMTIHPQSTGLQNVIESITVLKQILQVRKLNYNTRK